jgi:aryl-alcohol dehydrogenase-like predicted oxidoreductase
MPLDHYVTLGRSGLRVSPFCLGAMTFGEDLGWGSSFETSTAILDRFLALGGNFIDTANVYTNGHSEKIIGDHVGRTSSKRDRVVIATKFFGNLFAEDPNGGGAGAKSLIAATHESLRRLQTDYIDLLWMHAWDRNTPIEETMRALDDLVRAGKVLYVGASNFHAYRLMKALSISDRLGRARFISLQGQYGLKVRTVEREHFPLLEEEGLGFVNASPLAADILTGEEREIATAHLMPEHRKQRCRQSGHPRDGQQQENACDHGQRKADKARLRPLMRRQLPGEDGNKDDIVDAEDDFEHAEREKGNG